MKKKVLVTSLLTIALCISVICGATLAIFTSESKTNIAVQTGKVDVVATVDESSIKTYSNGKEMQENKFENGGSVSYADGEFTIDRITPGDKVTFDINIDNNSDIKILYKVGYTVDNAALEEAMVISFEGMTAGEWVAKNPGEEIGSVSASIELPFEASGVQGAKANIAVKVEAVQANANIADSAASLAEKIANAEAGDTIVLMDDITLDGTLNINGGKDIIIDGNGNTLKANKCNGIIVGGNSKVVLKNINFAAYLGEGIDEVEPIQAITANDGSDVVVDGCKIGTNSGIGHMVWVNAANSVVIKNCESTRPVLNIEGKTKECTILVENNTFKTSWDVFPMTLNNNITNITIRNNTNENGIYPQFVKLNPASMNNMTIIENVIFENNINKNTARGLIYVKDESTEAILKQAIADGKINLAITEDGNYVQA